ncbi:MAG: glutathione peroxidase [Gemmataceae bacterium]
MLKFLALVALVLIALPVQAADEASPLSYKMKSLDGKEVDLAKFKGKVVLIVNVASQCGLTGQYKPLQQLHDKYADKGLVIIGVPANDFGKQEPGSDAEIADFCKKNYGVKFLMLSKVPTVKAGKDQVPLYKFLTEKDSNGKFAGPIKWNFTKFLVGKDGKVAARFEPQVEPDDEDVVKKIEAELGK